MSASQEDIKEKIWHMVTRPEMWVISNEALEGMVLALLWAYDGHDRHNEWAMWCANCLSIRSNSPAWTQKEIPLKEYAELLSSFIREIRIF